MRTYGQLCAVARALDVVGDRWTLLIVRELLVREQARFSQLQRGLPGIAPNLLSSRLQDLIEHGVLERVAEDGSPGAGSYGLTARGRALEGVVRELLKWGAPTVSEAPVDASFQMHWLALPAKQLLRDGEPSGPSHTVRFGSLSDGFDALLGEGGVAVEPPSSDRVPVAVVDGPGPALVAMIQGALTPDRFSSRSIRIEGDADAVHRLLPIAAEPSSVGPSPTS